MSIRNPPSDGRHVHLQPETERLSRSARSVRSAQEHEHEHMVETVLLAPYGGTEFYLAGLFLGIPGVLMMAGMNTRRLGLPARATPVIVVGRLLLAAVVLIPIPVELLSLLGVVVSVIFVIGAVEWQKPHYRAWMHAHQNKQPTWSERGGWWNLAYIIEVAIVVNLVVSTLHFLLWGV